MSNEAFKEMAENVDKLRSVEETVLEATADDIEVSDNDSDTSDDDYTDIERKAMAMGWNPDKDSVPEGKEWIGADEFVRNEPLFKEIRKLKREMGNTKKSFDLLAEHHKKVDAIAKQDALAELKAQKKLALEDADHDAVIEIDDQILELKTAAAKVEENPAEDNEVFEEWIDNNSWYESNTEMRQAADEIGNGYYMSKNGNVSREKIYEHVEKQIKRMFPEQFSAPKSTKRTSNTVEGASASRSNRPSKSPKFTVKDLNETQMRVMRNFEKSGTLKPQEYIDELVRIGELG